MNNILVNVLLLLGNEWYLGAYDVPIKTSSGRSRTNAITENTEQGKNTFSEKSENTTKSMTALTGRADSWLSVADRNKPTTGKPIWEWTKKPAKASFRRSTWTHKPTARLTDQLPNPVMTVSPFAITRTTSKSNEKQDDDVCNEEKTRSKYGDIVIWPETKNNKRALSEPRCLNENLQFISRKCGNSDWIELDVEVCDTIQQTSRYPLDMVCPSSYDLIDDVCIMVTKKSHWSDLCFTLYNIGTSFAINNYHNIFAYLDKMGIHEFWLPAPHLEQDGFLWILLEEIWKEVVLESNASETQEGGICISLVIEKDNYRLNKLDCATKLPIICVQQATLFSQLTCPEGLYTTIYPELQEYCFGFRKIPPSTWSETYLYATAPEIFAIKSERLNRVLQYIMNVEISKLCWIAVEKNDRSEFHWKDGSIVSYVNWDVNEDYAESFGAIQNDGTWSLRSTDTRLDCYLFVQENKVNEPEIVLKFYPNSQKLELTIYWPESVLRLTKSDTGVNCFTDSGEPLVESVPIGDKIWESDWHNASKNQNNSETMNAHKVIYDIPLQQYPGNYWCECHMVKTLLLITSEKIFAYKIYYLHIYALLTEFPISQLESDRDYVKFIPKNENVEKYRIQKIIQIAENCTLAVIHMILKQPSRIIPDAKEIIRSYGTAKQIIRGINANSDIKVISMNNTLYCIPEEYMFQNEDVCPDKIKWDVAKLGHSVTASELCLQEDGLPIYRRCVGDNVFGAVWRSYNETCDSNGIPSQTTEILFELSTISIDNADHAANISNEVLELFAKMDALIPADIYYIGSILEKVSTAMKLEDSFNNKVVISNIISQTSRTNATNLMISQLALNSTNLITDSIQRLLEIIPTQETDLESSENGTMIVRTPQFIWQISNPSVQNISGLALIKRKTLSLFGDLDDYDIIPVMSHQSLNELLNIKGLEASTWIPHDLLEKLLDKSRETFQGKKPMIVISIYNNNSLFQEGRKDLLVGRIISVSIPGYGPNIPIPLPIVFRQNYDDKIPMNITESCTYWNYNPNKINIMGDWYKDGCVKTLVHETNDGNLTVCSCSHLTNFAQLITGSFKTNSRSEDRKHHENILNLITLIGCFLSILGILSIFAIAVLFKSWRAKTGTKVLLHLSLAIIIQMIIMILFNTDAVQVSLDDSGRFYSERLSCVITGAILHYSVMASFCWMIIIAFMQYLRYVRVLGVVRPAKFMLKSALIAWGCPLIPVLLTLFVDWTIYIPKSQLENSMCYPSGLALYLGVVLPIAVIVLINLVFYVLVLKSIFEKPKDTFRRNLDSDLLSSQLRVSIFLFFLLGLTWLFGLMMTISESIVFPYLFCITATFQGFALFIYFIVIDPSTRQLWKGSGKRDVSSSYTY